MQMAIAETAVDDFVEVLTEDPETALKGVHVGERSRLVGQTMAASGIHHNPGLLILGIRRSSGEMLLNPTDETVIEAGDTLITMGEADRQNRLQELASIPS